MSDGALESYNYLNANKTLNGTIISGNYNIDKSDSQLTRSSSGNCTTTFGMNGQDQFQSNSSDLNDNITYKSTTLKSTNGSNRVKTRRMGSMILDKPLWNGSSDDNYDTDRDECSLKSRKVSFSDIISKIEKFGKSIYMTKKHTGKKHDKNSESVIVARKNLHKNKSEIPLHIKLQDINSGLSLSSFYSQKNSRANSKSSIHCPLIHSTQEVINTLVPSADIPGLSLNELELHNLNQQNMKDVSFMKYNHSSDDLDIRSNGSDPLFNMQFYSQAMKPDSESKSKSELDFLQESASPAKTIKDTIVAQNNLLDELSLDATLGDQSMISSLTKDRSVATTLSKSFSRNMKSKAPQLDLVKSEVCILQDDNSQSIVDTSIFLRKLCLSSPTESETYEDIIFDPSDHRKSFQYFSPINVGNEEELQNIMDGKIKTDDITLQSASGIIDWKSYLDSHLDIKDNYDEFIHLSLPTTIQNDSTRDSATSLVDNYKKISVNIPSMNIEALASKRSQEPNDTQEPHEFQELSEPNAAVEVQASSRFDLRSLINWSPSKISVDSSREDSPNDEHSLIAKYYTMKERFNKRKSNISSKSNLRKKMHVRFANLSPLSLSPKSDNSNFHDEHTSASCEDCRYLFSPFKISDSHIHQRSSDHSLPITVTGMPQILTNDPHTHKNASKTFCKSEGLSVLPGVDETNRGSTLRKIISRNSAGKLFSGFFDSKAAPLIRECK